MCCASICHERCSWPDDQTITICDADGQRDVQRRGDEDAGHVHRDGALPRAPLERGPARQPQDAGREARPRIPVAQVEREQERQRRRPVGERRDVVVGLKAEKNPRPWRRRRSRAGARSRSGGCIGALSTARLRPRQAFAGRGAAALRESVPDFTHFVPGWAPVRH